MKNKIASLSCLNNLQVKAVLPEFVGWSSSSINTTPYIEAKAAEIIRKFILSIFLKNARLLDIMCGRFSYIPVELDSSFVLGIGLNELELKGNKTLSDFTVQDLNISFNLPEKFGIFNGAIMTSGIAYLINPSEVFKSLADRLEREGLVLIVFNPDYFDVKAATKEWTRMGAKEKISFVVQALNFSDKFKDVTTKTIEYPGAFDLGQELVFVTARKR